MELFNKGRKGFSAKAQYEREALAGCVCSSGSTTAKTITSTYICGCQCSSTDTKVANKNTAYSGTSKSSRSTGSAYVNTNC